MRAGTSGFIHLASFCLQGLTVLECALGHFPYDLSQGPVNFMLQVTEEDPPLPPPGAFSDSFRDFVAKCMQRDPFQRPPAEALLNHDWIRRNYFGQPNALADFISPCVDWAEVAEDVALQAVFEMSGRRETNQVDFETLSGVSGGASLVGWVSCVSGPELRLLGPRPGSSRPPRLDTVSIPLKRGSTRVTGIRQPGRYADLRGAIGVGPGGRLQQGGRGGAGAPVLRRLLPEHHQDLGERGLHLPMAWQDGLPPVLWPVSSPTAYRTLPPWPQAQCVPVGVTLTRTEPPAAGDRPGTSGRPPGILRGPGDTFYVMVHTEGNLVMRGVVQVRSFLLRTGGIPGEASVSLAARLGSNRRDSVTAPRRCSRRPSWSG